MIFQVKSLRRARQDVDSILEYIAGRSPQGAAAWARAYDKALVMLESSADRYPLAVENEHVEYEIREILFKTRRGLFYRALFTIREQEVFILHVRGPGQEFLKEEELLPPNAG